MCSVCGLIVPQEDLPFNDLGICPDVVSETFISSLTAVMHNLTDITPLDADNTLINGVQQDAIQLRTEPSYQWGSGNTCPQHEIFTNPKFSQTSAMW